MINTWEVCQGLSFGQLMRLQGLPARNHYELPIREGIQSEPIPHAVRVDRPGQDGDGGEDAVAVETARLEETVGRYGENVCRVIPYQKGKWIVVFTSSQAWR